MEARELRIGNYVYIDLSIDDIEVIKIKIGDLASFEIGVRDLFPIPLTKEWLLKFGFEINTNDLYQKGVYKLDYIENGKVNFLMFDVGDWWKRIEYVHELQNLYFLLTGEELTLINQ